MPRVSVDKQTGIRAATKKQWIMGACLGSYWVGLTHSDDERAYLQCFSTNPISLCILQITFPEIQPMNYYQPVQDRDLEAERV
jgi:hypothetical protein